MECFKSKFDQKKKGNEIKYCLYPNISRMDFVIFINNRENCLEKQES